VSTARKNASLHIFRDGLFRGISKGWSGFLWMLKILVPISFLTALVQWTGWLTLLDPVLRPTMALLKLPPTAALPIISGMLTGVYGGIAAMAVLPFTREQMTLMAVFILIVHNMIQEGVVQAKSGIHPLKATLFRVVAGTLTVLIISPFFESTDHASHALQAFPSATSLPFSTMLHDWALATLYLVAKIFLIIMGILITLELSKALGWIDHVVRLFSPILRFLGLDRRVGVLWITAVVFGLAYGAAVIVEEAKRGDLTRRELEVLHLSIGINHSMVEDPSLFLALGLSPFWLWIPRLLMAIAAVRLLKLWHTYKSKHLVDES
jgi:hypothetical protein